MGTDLVEMAERHADAIMRAAGSSLRHYMPQSRAEITSAVLNAIGEAYRAGAVFAVAKMRETE